MVIEFQGKVVTKKWIYTKQAQADPGCTLLF